jgi:hypothetical protein
MNQGWIPQHTPQQEQFALHKIVDEQNQGMVAATFEHPRDWTAVSQVFWNSEHVNRPMMTHAAVFNPNGTEAVEFLPIEAFFYLTPNFMYSPGQSSMGQVYMPQMRALDALVQLAIPKYRGDRQDMRVLHAETVPNLAQTINAYDELGTAPNEGVRALIRYVENGLTFEEMFYACCYWLPSNGAQTNWGLARLTCFRAERGQMESKWPTFWRIFTSWRNNPQWQQRHMQIAQQLLQGFAAFHADIRSMLDAQAKFGQQLAEYRQGQRNQQQQRLDDMFAADERKRQQEQNAYPAYSRSDMVGDLLRGVTAVDDPNNEHGNAHQDFGHHAAHWTAGPDDWFDTNDVNYDPNLDPTRNAKHWVRANERKLRS